MGTSQLAQRSAMRCIGACFSSASCTMRMSLCRELEAPASFTSTSTEPKQLSVPQKTSSPTFLSTGRDSPVMTDWSIDVSPLTIRPSTGILSPGRMRSTSPRTISSMATISSAPPLMRRPCVGESERRFFKPFFARSVIASSRSAPSAMMKATSPAAKRSPIAIAANIAMEIKSAEEILLMPRLQMMRRTDR